MKTVCWKEKNIFGNKNVFLSFKFFYFKGIITEKKNETQRELPFHGSLTKQIKEPELGWFQSGSLEFHSFLWHGCRKFPEDLAHPLLLSQNSRKNWKGSAMAELEPVPLWDADVTERGSTCHWLQQNVF